MDLQNVHFVKGFLQFFDEDPTFRAMFLFFHGFLRPSPGLGSVISTKVTCGQMKIPRDSVPPATTTDFHHSVTGSKTVIHCAPLKHFINFTSPFQNKCKQIWHKIQLLVLVV
jgi:hypothetical protein